MPHNAWQLPECLVRRPEGEKVRRILEAALEAVDPAACVRNALMRSENALVVGGETIDLGAYRRVFVIGMGKAALPMGQAVKEILGESFTEGIVVVKEGYGDGNREAEPASRFRILEAAHPVPDERGVAATRAVLALVKDLTPQDLVLCVVSGGGSALFTSPRAGLTLAHLQAVTSLLLGCGASIDEINTLRKCLDEVKGGGLARAIAPARLIALILLDVVGDPLDVVASGPCVENSTGPGDAWGVLEKYDLVAKVPPAVRAVLEAARGQPQDEQPAFPAGVRNVIVGSNRLAAQAALRRAQVEGFHALLLTTYLQGEARVVGGALAAVLRQAAADGQPLARPACIVAGGETTVTLRGNGLGGRNQEVALAGALSLAGLDDVLLLTLATDGGDGPTDAAGAAADGSTLRRAAVLGLNAGDALACNDSYVFFDALGDLLRTGPTRTNVNDLTFLFAF